MTAKLLVTVLLPAACLAGCSDGGGDHGAAPTATIATSPATTASPRGAVTLAPVTTAGGPTTTAGATPTCTPAMLALVSREGLGALGHALYVLQLRNVSAQACRTNGYPAVTLLAGNGRTLAEAQRGEGYILPNRPPAAVSVPAGGSAYFGVESLNVCDGGANPSVAQSIRVTLPDATGVLTLTTQMNVCGGQPVRVSPIRPSEREIAS